MSHCFPKEGTEPAVSVTHGPTEPPEAEASDDRGHTTAMPAGVWHRQGGAGEDNGDRMKLIGSRRRLEQKELETPSRVCGGSPGLLP